MHIVKREGMRCIALTEDEFDTVMNGFNCLMQHYLLHPAAPEKSVEDADSILTESLMLLAEDDGRE